MSGKVKANAPTPRTATRLPLFNQRGYKLRAGDMFKITGRNNWWRFVAYVIPVGEGESYIEAVEMKQKGQDAPPPGRGTVKNGAVRCLDASRVREVG